VITICLHGDKLTTADLEWFRAAVSAAAGHSGNDYPIEIVAGSISVEIPGDDEEKMAEEPLKLGDRVKITAAGDGDSHLIGKHGELIRIDLNDEHLTYGVKIFGGAFQWVKSVERVSD
jgi:hypothetical protein